MTKRKINGEIKILAGLALSTGLMGCSLMSERPYRLDQGTVEGYDRITFETAAGIRADADRMNGLLRTAKESRKEPPAYFEFRKQQEPEITKRTDLRTAARRPTFAERVMGKTEEK